MTLKILITLDGFFIKKERKENGRYYVDGYDENTNTIYEFNGCFYHGCLKCLKTFGN